MNNRPPVQEQLDALERKYERLRNALAELISAQIPAMRAALASFMGKCKRDARTACAADTVAQGLKGAMP